MRIVEQLSFNEHAKKQPEQMIHMEIKNGFHQFPCLFFFQHLMNIPQKVPGQWKLESREWCDNPTFL